MENEGYLGRINHPARSNHRVIRFQMEGNDWGFQYSPYAYFNEHSIFFYSKHEPMHISPLTFGRLLSIVEAFPGYFAGSNADLPIVGGSILTHEHYQGCLLYTSKSLYLWKKKQLMCLQWERF